MTLQGVDLYAAVPFCVVHIILEKDGEEIEFESNKSEFSEGEGSVHIRTWGSC
jgi:hypothetical protein